MINHLHFGSSKRRFINGDEITRLTTAASPTYRHRQTQIDSYVQKILVSAHSFSHFFSFTYSLTHPSPNSRKHTPTNSPDARTHTHTRPPTITQDDTQSDPNNNSGCERRFSPLCVGHHQIVSVSGYFESIPLQRVHFFPYLSVPFTTPLFFFLFLFLFFVFFQGAWVGGGAKEKEIDSSMSDSRTFWVFFTINSLFIYLSFYIFTYCWFAITFFFLLLVNINWYCNNFTLIRRGNCE